jgi:hypothetical protein
MIKFYYHPSPNPAKVALFLRDERSSRSATTGMDKCSCSCFSAREINNCS